MDESATHNVKVHGKKAAIAMKIALADLGGVQLELIEAENPTWRDLAEDFGLEPLE